MIEIDEIKRISIQKYKQGEKHEVEDDVIVEHHLKIYLNNQYFVTLLCTPSHLRELVYGYLRSEGIISTAEDVEACRIKSNGEKAFVELRNKDIFKFVGDHVVSEKKLTSACGKARSVVFPIVENNPPIKPVEELDYEKIIELFRTFNRDSVLFSQTGGVHSCALSDGNKILYFREDIGRHNALEKILGKALLEGLDLSDKWVLTTGRLSSEIADKVIKRGIPVLLSRSAPTDEAVTMAQKHGLGLIGFVRGHRLNIYS